MEKYHDIRKINKELKKELKLPNGKINQINITERMYNYTDNAIYRLLIKIISKNKKEKPFFYHYNLYIKI